jgi:hypothetical protein
MKLFGIVLLSIASLAVLLCVVLPVAWTQVLARVTKHTDGFETLGTPHFLLPVASNPLISLLAALLMLVVFGWGIWKLSR